jgi:ribokinase
MLMAMSDQPAVVVIGSINVDLIVGVRTLPGPGETVLGSRFIQQNGGKGANQAVAAARVGADVSMIGAVGKDELGRSALAGLGADGVDVSRCRIVEDTHTGLALIVVDDDGENQIAVASGANARLDGAMVHEATAGLTPGSATVCLISFEISDAAVISAARWATEHGLRTVVNPAPARPLADELLDLRPILTPNATEAAMLSGESNLQAAAERLAARSGAPVIITNGGAGSLLCENGTCQQLPALPVEPVDTTGAGDALNGILAAELARGQPLRVALRWAMAGASLTTTVSGAQSGLPSRETIARHIS